MLRTRNDHMAIVVDEFGSTVGMITMEDVLEEVVGEIDVGYDFDEYLPRRPARVRDARRGGLSHGLAPPDLRGQRRARDPPSPEESHTIGGLVMNRLRRIPVRGESIVEAGLSLHGGGGERTVLKLRVAPVGAAAPAPAGRRRGEGLTRRDRSDRKDRLAERPRDRSLQDHFTVRAPCGSCEDLRRHIHRSRMSGVAATAGDALRRTRRHVDKRTNRPDGDHPGIRTGAIDDEQN